MPPHMIRPAIATSSGTRIVHLNCRGTDMRRLGVLLIAISTLLTGCIVYDSPHRDGHRVDRDRDNDGVPNRMDRRPSDPYRY